MRAACTCLLVMAACGLPEGDYFGRIPDDIDPRHLRWCNQGEPDHLDPAYASSTVSAPLVTTLFDALTTYGPDGNPVPSLATHWDVDPMFTRFTFHLRPGARFTNGRALTAYDVALSLLRIAHPTTASPNADNVGALTQLAGYLARTRVVLTRDAGPYRAGTIVEITGDDAAARARLALRASTNALRLRDLGAAPSASYATVPPGAPVTLLWTTGGRATPPHPGDEAWAYIAWARDHEGVQGWVPARELDAIPHAADLHAIRHGDGPLVQVPARDLLHTPDVLGVAVPDARTIVFETAAPTPYFVASTSSRAMRVVPLEAVSRHPRSWMQAGRAVTSGPMHLTYWRRRDRVELVRSPTYWNPGDVKLDQLTAYSIDDQAAATNFYFTGRCDAVATNNIPSTYLPALNGELRGGRAYKDYRVDPYLTTYFLWLQTEKLTNRHLRRALALAVDRTQVPRFTHGNELPTTQLSPGTPIAQLADADLAACGVTRATPGFALVMEPGKLCYVPPPGLAFDEAAARRELAEARKDPSWREPLEYRYNAGSEAHKQIAEYLQASWKRIGLDVELVAQEWNSMLEDSREGRFQILRLGVAGSMPDAESEFMPLFRCGSPDNRGRYCSAEFERLMNEARTISDRRARNAKIREAEGVMLADAPVIPIYVYTQKHLIKPYVRDYAINLIDQPSLWRVWLDPSWRQP